jgi:hypothetical protein
VFHGLIDGCWCHHEGSTARYPLASPGRTSRSSADRREIADAYDAMTSDRACRAPARGRDRQIDALEITPDPSWPRRT